VVMACTMRWVMGPAPGALSSAGAMGSPALSTNSARGAACRCAAVARRLGMGFALAEGRDRIMAML
jgi:hypothetical protein